MIKERDPRSERVGANEKKKKKPKSLVLCPRHDVGGKGKAPERGSSQRETLHENGRLKSGSITLAEGGGAVEKSQRIGEFNNDNFHNLEDSGGE